MGFDVDQQKVDSLKRGQSYIKHINSAKKSVNGFSRICFEATTDMKRSE